MNGEERESTLKALLRDLEIEPSLAEQRSRDLRAEFGGLLNLRDEALRRVGLDAAVTVGLAGDWNLALELTQRLVQLGDDALTVKLWQLRALTELERFAEALALSAAVRWGPALMLHVNYLSGTSFEALGMRDQARMRFTAVAKLDARYRNVTEKLRE